MSGVQWGLTEESDVFAFVRAPLRSRDGAGAPVRRPAASSQRPAMETRGACSEGTPAGLSGGAERPGA